MRFVDGDLHAYFSAIDADSENEEGKFYVWSLDEINKILKDESSEFVDQYGLKSGGNWEGKNILHRIGRDKNADFIYETSKRNTLNLKALQKDRSSRNRPFVNR